MGLKIKITRLFLYDGEHTKAFVAAKCQIAGRVFGFNDLTIVKAKEGDGLFLGLPSRPTTHEGEYKDVYYMDQNTKKEIEKVAIDLYKKKIKGGETVVTED